MQHNLTHYSGTTYCSKYELGKPASFIICWSTIILWCMIYIQKLGGLSFWYTHPYDKYRISLKMFITKKITIFCTWWPLLHHNGLIAKSCIRCLWLLTILGNNRHRTKTISTMSNGFNPWFSVWYFNPMKLSFMSFCHSRPVSEAL